MESSPVLTDSNYKNDLEKMENIRQIVRKKSLEINLSQITVIGDQSSGKSSLLTEISGVSFPINNGTTTRCPIIVHTKYNSKLTCEKYTIYTSTVATNTPNVATSVSESDQELGTSLDDDFERVQVIIK